VEDIDETASIFNAPDAARPLHDEFALDFKPQSRRWSIAEDDQQKTIADECRFPTLLVRRMPAGQCNPQRVSVRPRSSSLDLNVLLP
jgi:hypothetical protein